PSSPGQIFYGLSNHPVAPPGTIDNGNPQNSGSSGYTIQQPVTQSPQDLRLGTIEYSGQTQILPKPDQVVVPGPVDASVNPSESAQQLLSGSALWGTIQLNTDNSQQLNQNNSSQSLYNPNSTQSNQESSVFNSSQAQGNSTSVGPVPIQARIRQIRQELTLQNSVAPTGNGTQSGSATGANLTGSGASLLQPLQPGNQASGFNEPLTDVNSSNSQLKSGSLSPTAGDVSTDQSNRTFLPSDESLPPPTQQSALYAKLRQSMEDYDGSHSMTDEQANRKFQEIRHLQQLAQSNAESGSDVLTGKGNAPTQLPGGLPSGIPGPDQSGTNNGPQQEAAPGQTGPKTSTPDFSKLPTNLGGPSGMNAVPASPAPVPIDSFATGIKSKGLADLIGTAEENVENQRYDKAIANYNEAIDAAPNNPLIIMARATAELGGGYYAQANADIHVAVAQDPAILLGQYDLQKHLGTDRLKSLITDLKQISEDAPDDTLHSFLLSFVYYNSHHLGQAAQWLENTDKRSAGQDPAISQMKRYWNFSEAPAPAAKPNGAAPSAGH
ncbi:MAG TPA: hypothetical protein VHX86_04585, partial [Tepidisphaeraceae bacterium]|nr:hypothetical protein [Tepidisphaeraceae bacterium]